MRKLHIMIAVAVAVLAGTALAVAVVSGDSDNDNNEMKVAATIFPVYDITQEIAGDDFEVVLMLPAGASPHTFDPQPSLVKDLEGTQTVFAIGNGLDEWSDNLTDSVGAELVTVDSGVDLIENGEDDHSDEEGEDHDDEHSDEDENHGNGDDSHFDEEDEHAHDDEEEHEDENEEHHDDEDGEHSDEEDEYSEDEDEHHDDEDDHSDEKDEHAHDHGPIDPHYWLSIHGAEQIAMNIAEELGELDSENAQTYTNRATAYAAELETLETELQQQVAGLEDNNIISLHDAWNYFAADLGLNIVGTFEPAAGEEPTPQYLANLQDEVAENNVTTLFVEPQLSTASIDTFADDNNLAVAVIDPLGGVEGRNSYIELMRYNVDQVVSALGNNE